MYSYSMIVQKKNTLKKVQKMIFTFNELITVFGGFYCFIIRFNKTPIAMINIANVT